ncbi:MAG: signal recognition particle-docking protein FtsY, partial [Nitrospinota bacterium]
MIWKRFFGDTAKQEEEGEERRPEEASASPQKRGFLQALRAGLSKTRQQFLGRLETVLRGKTSVTEELLEELEEILITSDIGVHSVERILTDLRRDIKEARLREPEQIMSCLQASITRILEQGGDTALHLGSTPPAVILVVGVNGVGKTTSIAKLAHRFTQEGKKVLLAAGDTFRAAAIEQLEVWAARVGVEMIKHQPGADPSAVIYDAIQAARSRRYDLVIADTAGRLHTKGNLMEELKKMKRVVSRE